MRSGSNGVNDNNKILNKRNKSGENGISWCKRKNYWYCDVGWRVHKKSKHKAFSSFQYKSEFEAFEAAKRFRDEKYAEIGNENGKRRRTDDGVLQPHT